MDIYEHEQCSPAFKELATSYSGNSVTGIDLLFLRQDLDHTQNVSNEFCSDSISQHRSTLSLTSVH